MVLYGHGPHGSTELFYAHTNLLYQCVIVCACTNLLYLWSGGVSSVHRLTVSKSDAQYVTITGQLAVSVRKDVNMVTSRRLYHERDYGIIYNIVFAVYMSVL